MGEVCALCGTKMGNGLFKVAPAYPNHINAFERLGIDASEWCQNCMDTHRKNQIQKIQTEIVKNEKILTQLMPTVLDAIELFTIPPLESWKGVCKGLVSGYSVIGTGPISEILSSWTDFFGAESKSYVNKLHEGKKSAIMGAKIECLEKDADMIVGCHLSIQEATSGHGMLMISCVGTAFQRDELPESTQKATAMIKENKRLTSILNQLKTIGDLSS